MGKKVLRVLVLGGYGNFGKIIATGLGKIEGVAVIIAGRNLQKAESLATKLGVASVKLDANQADLAQELERLNIDVLISTAGPFQGQDYTVAKAAIQAGSHYIDLADARAFVCGISELDVAAKKQNILVCAGASSVPGLSSAVVDAYLPEFQELESINHGISSSERTPGVSTLEAVLHYCGRPIKIWKNHQWQNVFGWQSLQGYSFRKAIEKRFVGNCEVPDLTLFPLRYRSVGSVSFSAGVGLKTTQFGTWVLSWLVRIGLIRQPQKLSKILHKGATLMEPLGNGLSGMFVRLQGKGLDQKPLEVLWELVAFDNEGSNIPCVAAIALVRKLKAEKLIERGAMSSMGLVNLDEYLFELKEFPIEVDVYRSTD